jgi:hypothetical protein
MQISDERNQNSPKQIILYLWYGTFNIAKMSSVTKLNYIFNAIPRETLSIDF